MKTHLLTLTCLALVAGCSAPRPTRITVVPRRDSQPANGLTELIRYPELVKAYHVGRWIDPAGLHEAHTVYRVEAQAHWNLHSPPGCFVLPSVVGSLTNAAYVPPALNEAAIAELNQQRAVTRTVSQQSESLGRSLQELSSTLAANRSLIEQNKALRDQLSRIEARLDAAEAKLRGQGTPTQPSQ